MQDTLRTISKVRSLSLSEAKKGYPLQLEGVITYCQDHIHRFCFLQDDTDGIYLDAPSYVMETGSYVEVSGFTVDGWFAPNILPGAKIKFVKEGTLPNPLSSNFFLLAGKYDSKWAVVEGIVRKAEHFDDGNGLKGSALDLAIGDEIITVHIKETQIPKNLIGAIVRITGVAGGEFNEDRQLIGILLFVEGWEYLDFIKEGIQDPLALPVSPINEINAFSLEESRGHLTHIRGQVTQINPGGGYLVVQDTTGGARVYTDDLEDIHHFDVIDVAGFTEVGGLAPVLKHVTFRSQGPSTSLLEPTPYSQIHQDSLSLDTKLIQLASFIEDINEYYDIISLTMIADSIRYKAEISSSAYDKHLREGSMVQVTGVAEAHFAGLYEEQPAASPFTLHLRDSNDIKVLENGPWLTKSRAQWLVTWLLGLLLLRWPLLMCSYLFALRICPTTFPRSACLRKEMAHSNFSAEVAACLFE